MLESDNKARGNRKIVNLPKNAGESHSLSNNSSGIITGALGDSASLIIDKANESVKKRASSERAGEKHSVSISSTCFVAEVLKSSSQVRKEFLREGVTTV